LADVLKNSLSVESIEYAFIFGSIASGEEKPESDVDLFVIGNISLRELSKLLKEANTIIDREINPYTITMKDFIKRKMENDHFITRVLNSSKIIIKGSIDDIEKLGE
jgi:predicted nucleotidyltransferase|nr:nucleotidyltransferase domain-containing protein [Candidatus Delongbacteria bacterium]